MLGTGEADEDRRRRAQDRHAHRREGHEGDADRGAEHAGDQSEPVAQQRQHHRHVAGRERDVEPVRLGVDRRPDERADQRARVPEREQHQAGRPERVALVVRTVLRRRHRGRLVDRELRGEQPLRQRAGDDPRHRQPVHGVAGGQDHRARRAPRRSSRPTRSTLTALNCEAPVNTSSDITHDLRHRSAGRHRADTEHEGDHARPPRRG